MQISDRLPTLTLTHAVRHTARATLTLALSAPALGQTRVPPVAETVSLSGPRFGVTFLSDGIVRKLQPAARPVIE